uniref:F-actin-capping protein subunit alpha n=1 Tax=Geotrypetes seraphini TaxID=260995 RepID=A0A6P8P4K0_GEOSA|nr:F-actin-capping protein subunit alpha-1-like [Geotrypetes seraphini]XP_033775880.1 F-actin-capping protein subunit alpha-1-like [Geotrypetes seraphini]XP_033775881.1 F-actin-capping protein subunit alpha-1-like [Geotrypetes seraphini]XP_033775882.1 F-actin-capping protein subunit alpha-1-like [Geotrypetes seraphini]
MLNSVCALPEAREKPKESTDKHHLAKESRVQAVRSLLKQAFPGEFSCVFSDIRLLINDDFFMRKEASQACAIHNKDSFTPVKVEKYGCEVLLTHHNDLGDSRFFDPQAKLSFKYDHLSKEASDFQPYPRREGKEDSGDRGNYDEETDVESWRSNFQSALKSYVKSHFRSGVCSIFQKILNGRNIFVACMECHVHKPSAFWNGIWRSEWIFPLTFPVTRVTGSITVQAHYFEEGNIHLTVCKGIEETLHLNNKAEASKGFAQMVEEADSHLQNALMEEYGKISDQVLKTIRRQLPITHCILDWNKMLASKVLETDFVH